MFHQRIEISREFAVPVSRLFAFLEQDEKLALMFPSNKVRHVSDGSDARYGLGATREVRAAVGAPFIETITAYRVNELIEYRITSGSLLNNHHGVMRFSATTAGGARLDYRIEFDAKFPPLAPLIRFLLARDMRHGLANLRVD